MKKKAIFLDRDGVINKDKNYVYKFEDIEWVPGIFELISYANLNDFLVFVLTNQSGVARGMYSEKDVTLLHQQMDQYLKEQKLIVTDWFYCLDFDSHRRKPGPGMMIEAAKRYDVDLNCSIMIGDKPSDVLNLDGPKYFLVEGNYSLEKVKNNPNVKIFENISSIVKVLFDA